MSYSPSISLMLSRSPLSVCYTYTSHTVLGTARRPYDGTRRRTPVGMKRVELYGTFMKGVLSLIQKGM